MAKSCCSFRLKSNLYLSNIFDPLCLVNSDRFEMISNYSFDNLVVRLVFRFEKVFWKYLKIVFERSFPWIWGSTFCANPFRSSLISSTDSVESMDSSRIILVTTLLVLILQITSVDFLLKSSSEFPCAKLVCLKFQIETFNETDIPQTGIKFLF